MTERKRLDIKAILKNPDLRKKVVERATDFICKVEGIRRDSPELERLLEVSQASPELERIRGDVVRHKAAGRHDPARTVHSIERYVVEPAAIAAAAASRQGDKSLPWFRMYGKEVRKEVAQRLAARL